MLLNEAFRVKKGHLSNIDFISSKSERNKEKIGLY